MGSADVRTRGDLCPGILRPWSAQDGLVVRLRLVGGRITGRQLDDLLAVAERFGDGAVHLTGRANLQVRGLPGDGCLPPEVVDAFEATGLVPSRAHELVRNIMVSPQSGYAGGRADLRPVAAELDRLLLNDPQLGSLPGRFLFVLDDGRGDLVDARADLGLVAVNADRAQLRIGDVWGPTVDLHAAASSLVDLARRFLAVRGTGPTAAWHIRELSDAARASLWREPDLDRAEPLSRPGGIPISTRLGFGRVDGGTHVSVDEGRLTRSAGASLLSEPTLIVTPWRGIFVPSADAVQLREHA